MNASLHAFNYSTPMWSVNSSTEQMKDGYIHWPLFGESDSTLTTNPLLKIKTNNEKEVLCNFKVIYFKIVPDFFLHDILDVIY